MKQKLEPRELLKKLLPIILIIAIFSSALWLRSFPARYSEIQALDPFFFYRMGLDAMNNDWRLDVDLMRYHPTGVDTVNFHYLLPIYLPALVFTLITSLGVNMHYLHFAIMWPALLGALAIIPMYFLGKEITGSRMAGMFSAFFLSTVPAFITRTSAGFFEKEPIAGVFIITSVYFFVRAFKRSSWISGSIAGLSLAATSLAWGGVQYIYMLFAGFLALIFLANFIVAILDYLFEGFGGLMETLNKYMSLSMIKAYLPVLVFGSLVQQLFARHIPLSNVAILGSTVMFGVLAVRYGAERFSLVKKEYLPYVVPALLVLMFSGTLVGAMFSDSLAGNMRQVTGLLTFSKSVIGTTVAENAPGNWDNIASVTGASFARAVSPELASFAPLTSIYLLMFLGAGVMIYRFFRTREWLYLIPVLWMFTSIAGVFYYVRLVFLLGPPAALSAGIFAAWLVGRLRETKLLDRKIARLKAAGLDMKLSYIVVGLVVFLMLSVNMASAFAYSLNLGPSVCFPRYNSEDPFDVQPCITIDENGNEVMAPNQPWYEAFAFMQNNTAEDASILSWWDFGYWFQSRGERPSIADGGHTGGIYQRTDHEIADWYVDDTDNWDSYRQWFNERDMDYILMDYTLPGKYGAISKIASNGDQVVGMLQFSQQGVEPNGNESVYIFRNGQYEIWMPLDSQGILKGTPMFLVSQNGQYMQKSYINDVCTVSGITRAGNEDPSIPGCVAISDLGLYYIPPEAENSIFTNLMFMGGVGLPVEKVFDNRMVKIYKIDYDAWDSMEEIPTIDLETGG